MRLKKFIYNRIWKQNSSLVQLLGLCPVLAMTTNVVNAIGLGLTTTLVLILTNTTISLLRFWIPKDLRIPIYMIIISSVVTCIEMLIHAYQLHLYLSLGVFIPLIVTNCIIVARADFIAYKNSTLISFFDGMLIGLGATASMFIIGAIRELLGSGTLFFGINRIFTIFNSTDYLTLFNSHSVISLAILPPGGFLILGFIIALKNMIDINKNNIFSSPCTQCICANKIQK